jgi:hypothetical protein
VLEKVTFDSDYMTNTGEFKFAADLPTYALFQSKDYHNNYQLI